MIGTCEAWRGTYGFLEAADGRRYFCHFSDIAGTGFRELRPGQVVQFDLGRDDQGRARAVGVVPVDA